MHDIRAIRDDVPAFVMGLRRRGLADADHEANDLLALDQRLRELQTALQRIQARRNDASKQIGAAKTKKDDTLAEKLIAEVAMLKEQIQSGEDEERGLREALAARLMALPNVPATDVPDGQDETHNIEVNARAFGAAPGMNAPKDHVDLGTALGMLDFAKAAKVAGARFVYMTGAIARLERALASFMLDVHTREFGYLECSPPLLLRDAAMFGTGQLPKFADDLFQTFKAEEGPSSRLWLVPTSEVSLANYVADEIVELSALPLRFTAATPCFRAEAGAAGRDTRGMIRMHQFSKVELVSVVEPEESERELERMTDCAQEILKRLSLHHRVMALCAGDLGFAARKTYDIEVWLPGQDRFREISSCSNCGDFQARRMNARYRPNNVRTTRFVHTLNGSGLAIGRTIVAIMENFQDSDGGVAVPEALRPYMGGLERIAK